MDLYTPVDRCSHFLARSLKCFPRCRGVFGLALSACLPIFVQRRQERSSNCWPFAPPKPAWGPSRLRKNRLRRYENGLRELPSFLRHAGSLAYYLVDVVDKFSDHALPEESRLQLASVEWPGLRCRPYTAVVGKSSPKIHGGQHHVVVRVRFNRPVWLWVYFYVVYSRSVCLAC